MYALRTYFNLCHFVLETGRDSQECYSDVTEVFSNGHCSVSLNRTNHNKKVLFVSLYFNYFLSEKT